MDPFEALGLPASFDLDPGAIQRAYLSRSARLHPDLAASDAEAPRQMAVLNDAKRVLEDPERRANAVLARLGGLAKEKDKSLPEGFLAEMMETREAIEGAVSDPARRAEWEAWALERRRQAASEVGGMFRSLSSPLKPAELSEIRRRLNAWRYVERLIEQLDPDYEPNRADFETR